MRLSAGTSFSTVLLSLILPQTISALTLSNFQPISGFNAACTNAYNTPLTDCSNLDFSGQGCSAKCIGFLDSLTKTLSDVCAGTSAPNTLIGLFFSGQGVQTVCYIGIGSSSSSGSGGGNGQSGGQIGAPDMQSTLGETSVSTTTITTSTSSQSTSSTPQAAATTSTTTVIPTTVTPEPTTTSVAVVGTTVAPETPLDTSTSTTQTESSTSTSTSISTSTSTSTSTSSTSTSTSNGSGGGTPLDIESSACHDVAVSVWLFALLAGSAGIAWLP